MLVSMLPGGKFVWLQISFIFFIKPSALCRQELVTLFVPLAANRCSESSERKLVSGV